MQLPYCIYDNTFSLRPLRADGGYFKAEKWYEDDLQLHYNGELLSVAQSTKFRALRNELAMDHEAYKKNFLTVGLLHI